MPINDSPLNPNFQQNQFTPSSSSLAQSADKAIQRIQGFQSKITETQSAKGSIVDKQKALGRLEAKVLKAKGFLNDVDENFNQLVAQKKKLKSELEELKPVLLIEPIYPSLVKPEYQNALMLFAKERAKELGLPLLAVTQDTSLPLYGEVIHSLGSPAPYEYSDTADRSGFAGGVTEGIYKISQARVIQA